MVDIPRYPGWQEGSTPILDPSLHKVLTGESQRRHLGKKAGGVVAGCLSPRQHETLYYGAWGFSVVETGHSMATSPNTIKTLRDQAFAKLDANYMTEAVLKGVAIGAFSFSGLMHPEEPELLKGQLFGLKGDVLNQLVQNYGKDSTRSSIAKRLSYSTTHIGRTLNSIMEATSIHSRVRLAIIRFSLEFPG